MPTQRFLHQSDDILSEPMEFVCFHLCCGLISPRATEFVEIYETLDGNRLTGRDRGINGQMSRHLSISRVFICRGVECQGARKYHNETNIKYAKQVKKVEEVNKVFAEQLPQ